MARKDLNEVHLLRGVASVLVCLFHLMLGNNALLSSTNLFKQFFQTGYICVEIFFILSGYVICYSFPARYTHRQMGTFLKKRLIRIEPPYVASILLVILLNYLSTWITAKPLSLDWLNIAGHLAYLNNFGWGTYVNVVYWTLGVEFQFYLLIALLFPVLLKKQRFILILLGGFLLLTALPLFQGLPFVSRFLSFFTLGMLVFLFKIQKRLSLPLFAGLVLLFFTQIFFSYGFAAVCISALAMLVLLFWKAGHPVILFFSAISYSLYLTHVPVGGKIINLGLRFTGDSVVLRYLLTVLAFLASLSFAYLFYRFVEKPALRYAKRFRYSAGPPQAPAPVVENRPAPTVLRPAAPGVPA